MIRMYKKHGFSMVAFILAIGPILDPYILFDIGSITVRLMDIALLLALYLVLVRRGKIYFVDQNLIIFIIILTFLTLLSLLAPIGERSAFLALKNLALWIVYLFLVNELWINNMKDKFLHYVSIIAIFAVAVLFIQFISINIGINNVFDGQLPFLEISEYDGWAGLIDPNTYEIRVHSFFQEPSYLGIYCLPILAMSLNEHRYKLSIYLLLGLIISTSLLSLLGALIVLVIFVAKLPLKSLTNRRSTTNAVVMLIIIIFLTTVLYATSDTIKATIDISTQRVQNLTSELSSERMGSAKLRVIGFSSYFSEMNTYLKFVGSGAGQFKNLLSNSSIVSYSSNVVTILLNFGLLGILAFSYWLLLLYKGREQSNRIFVIIFALICCIDYCWFNWYFYYLLTWCYLNSTLSNTKAK